MDRVAVGERRSPRARATRAPLLPAHGIRGGARPAGAGRRLLRTACDLPTHSLTRPAVSTTRHDHEAEPTPAAFWPSRTVSLAALCLPKGIARERYRAEFLAELPGLTNRQQMRHAAGVLTHAGSLWMA